MNKTIFGTGVLFGILAVILGAFASHGLKSLVDDAAITSFKTGVTYQMYHALLLLVLGSLSQISKKHKKLIYLFITFGVLFFSFSIYLLATNSLTPFDVKSIAFITPVGGFLLIIGWVLLGIRTLKDIK